MRRSDNEYYQYIDLCLIIASYDLVVNDQERAFLERKIEEAEELLKVIDEEEVFDRCRKIVHERLSIRVEQRKRLVA